MIEKKRILYFELKYELIQKEGIYDQSGNSFRTVDLILKIFIPCSFWCFGGFLAIGCFHHSWWS